MPNPLPPSETPGAKCSSEGVVGGQQPEPVPCVDAADASSRLIVRMHLHVADGEPNPGGWHGAEGPEAMRCALVIHEPAGGETRTFDDKSNKPAASMPA